ncbi:trihelix transcription factor ENAP1-like [Typha latifolia]|uniref:trihelix transcription factor ENAP1-like n=1 Tax=Typha latifolia TaxID=4733 RepID=UPI003C304CDC
MSSPKTSLKDSPSPPSPPAPPIPPASAAPPASGSSRRLPPPCWSHEETVALIDAYRRKWLSLRRGNLRAADWQEVADAIAAAVYSSSSSPKTAVQCRHKVEKLRKRFRAERNRSLSRDPTSPPSSSWPFFPKLAAMDLAGPSPSPAPRSHPPPPSSSDSSDDDDNNTRSLHRLMSNGAGSALRFTIPKASRSKNPSLNRFARPAVEEMRRRLEKRRKLERDSASLGEEEDAAFGAVATAVSMLGDGFMRVEQMKMEMTREMEKVRMEMEIKRTEMILESQRRIVDTFVKGVLRGKKRTKVLPEN